MQAAQTGNRFAERYHPALESHCKCLSKLLCITQKYKLYLAHTFVYYTKVKIRS
jgi:hypothetical protein